MGPGVLIFLYSLCALKRVLLVSEELNKEEFEISGFVSGNSCFYVFIYLRSTYFCV